ncbi:MAG TPA: hypothetical protein GXZ32_08660 [Clostridiales bacterium]|nr:hypothetical protein [Clostridiales bacterium]
MKSSVKVLSLILTILFFLCACSAQGASVNNETGAQNEASIESGSNGATNEEDSQEQSGTNQENAQKQSDNEKESSVSEYRQQEVAAAFEELFSELVSYAGKDYDKFNHLFRNSSEDAMKSLYDENWSEFQQDKNIYSLICSRDNFYFTNVNSYIVTGQHPNSRLICHSYTFPLSCVDDEWKFDYSDEAIAALDAESTENASLYPEGFLDAWKSGGNSAMLTPLNYMYLDNKCVYEGYSNFETKFAWQNDDGSVNLAFWIANGTDLNIYYKTATVTMTNNDNETIISLSDIPVDIAVPAMTSKIHVVQIPKSQVQNSTSKWEDVAVHTRAFFE